MLANYRATQTPNQVDGVSLKYLAHDYQLNATLLTSDPKSLERNWTVDPNAGFIDLFFILTLDWDLFLIPVLFEGGFLTACLVWLSALAFSEIYSTVRRIGYDVVPMGTYYGQLVIAGYLVGCTHYFFKTRKFLLLMITVATSFFLLYEYFREGLAGGFSGYTPHFTASGVRVAYMDDHFGRSLALITGLAFYFVRPYFINNKRK